MAKYTKKPIEIEAIQWTGMNLEEIKSFVGDSLLYEIIDTAWQVGKGAPRVYMVIKTLEGVHICTEGDFIIKGVNGEFYPCKPDIFEKTYQSHAVEMVEVVHARWDKDGRCTNCGGHAPFYFRNSLYYESPYCFECGAKMDGATDNNVGDKGVERKE